MRWSEYMAEKAYHLHTLRWELLALKTVSLYLFVSLFFRRIIYFTILLTISFAFYTLWISCDVQNICNTLSDGTKMAGGQFLFMSCSECCEQQWRFRCGVVSCRIYRCFFPFVVYRHIFKNLSKLIVVESAWRRLNLPNLQERRQQFFYEISVCSTSKCYSVYSLVSQ